MSVIVKGMEMPTKCCDCDAENYVEGDYGYENCYECSFVYKGYTDDIRDRGRLKECPLSPLPYKHGRLIDGDEVKTAFPCGESVRTECVRATIDNMPTIVDAEGE